jgi:hypothetical protein
VAEASIGAAKEFEGIPGREAISRGHGAKRGESKSKRHHGPTQPRKTTHTYPRIPHREFPTVVTDSI